jgi:phosphoglycolate phosphatase
MKKPNPRLLADICSREGFKPSDAIYIGDSLVKDISMANDAGVDSVYAEYGRQRSEILSTLVSITHWTKSDVEKRK